MASMRSVVPPDASVRIELLRRAVAARPESAGLLFDLAEAFLDIGDERAAADSYRRAALLAPGSRFPGARMAGALARQGVLFPQVLAGLALAEGRSGNEAAVRHLIDYDRFVRRTRFPTPSGFTRQQFHHALAEEIRSTLTFYEGSGSEPATRSWQNNSILDAQSPAWLAYCRALQAEIDGYVAGLSPDDDHPFVRSRPDRWRLDAHALVSREGGFIRPHFHPRAWISAVFYVLSPPSSRAPNSRQGWLSLNPPPGYEDLPGWETRLFEPEEGMLLIMPGHFFHSTIPVSADEERISLVVDVMDAAFPLLSSTLQ
jgi:hypothetical protein